MKSFIKGFLLGFGLMACFFIGIVVTKVYEMYILPDNKTHFSLKTSAISIKDALLIADEYSKELGAKCSIEDFVTEIAAPSLKASNSAQIEANSAQIDDNAKETTNTTSSTTEASDSTQEPATTKLEQRQIYPVAKAASKSYLRLVCERSK